MIYVMSDIHGRKDRFDDIMKQINLKDDDTLYILGDVVDRNPHGVALLKYIMEKPNIKMLLGNHDLMLYETMRYKGKKFLWYSNGGEITHERWKKYRIATREKMLDFIYGLPLMLDIEVNGKPYRLVHGRSPTPKQEYYLSCEEKSFSTIGKYIHDVNQFMLWLKDRPLDKKEVLTYKSDLIEHYAPASVNASLSSLNGFFAYMEWYDLRVKNLKIQKQIFASANKELTKAEYQRLLLTAKRQNNERLYLLMQTICSTGIRVSEVRYITVEAVRCGAAEINCKGKRRQVFLPKQLCHMLKSYIQKKNRKSGPVFVTKNGQPLDRSNIWSDMKKICREANVSEKKVFPHNLRHLFARTYYSLQKDIVRLADILGHSSVNTTRIYTMESGEIHRRHIEKMGLLRC